MIAPATVWTAWTTWAATPWPWLALGLAAGLLLSHRGRRRDRAAARALWRAAGRPDEPPRRGPALPELLTTVQRLAGRAARADQLQLRTIAAERRAALSDAVLGSLHDGVVVIDRTERVLYANQTARALLRCGDREHPTLDQAETPFEIAAGMRTVLAADLARGVKACRVEWQSDDRRHVYLIRAAVEASLGDEQRAHVVVLEDWTAEERAARAKSEFIYGVSHELKTPLTAIQASLELANDDPGLSPEDRDKLIRASYEESVRLSRMVAELLDLARVEAGITEFRRDTVDMRELFASLQGLHQPLADRKHVTLKWDISDYLADLVGDARLLRQAFVNIVGNAVKYTKAGGEVALTARLEGSEIVTRVRDTGIGIASEDQPRIFEKFFRAKSAEQAAIQGTGLGLPMARYIIERHRGRIELSSEIGVGTEFRVYLPAKPTDPDDDGGVALLAVDSAEETR